jgi:hypothetical protein
LVEAASRAHSLDLDHALDFDPPVALASLPPNVTFSIDFPNGIECPMGKPKV